MAATKTKRTTKKSNSAGRKRKNNGELNKVTVTVVIIILMVGLSVLAFLYRDDMTPKVKQTLPSGFNYPTKYEEYVVKYSKQYNVDPVLVFSVINVESHFNEKATSDVGARGLMQIMNDAYDWLKFRLNDKKSKSFDDMYDPQTNIKYGTYYLSYLMKKYNGSVDLTVAAYHCGMGQVDSWIEKGTIKINKKGKFNTDDIPQENDQTSHYIDKIHDSYKEYKKILTEQDSQQK